MTPLVGCFLWDGQPAARGLKYGPEHVHALVRQVARYLPGARVVVVADRNVPHVETIRFTPEAVTGPGSWSWPKLLMWSGITGERTLWLDLDTVIVADMAPLVDRPEPVVMWRDPSGRGYNTSMVLMDHDAAPQVWSARTQAVGNDQSWASQVLGPKMPTWGTSDGVASWKRHCRPTMPDGTRVVFFHGRPKPWDLPEWVDRWACL